MWNAKSPAERARLDRPSTLDLLQLCKAGKNVDIFRAFLYKAGIRGHVLDQFQALRNAVCHKAPLTALFEITGLLFVLGATSQMEKVKTLSNGFALFRQKQQEAADTVPTSTFTTTSTSTSTTTSTSSAPLPTSASAITSTSTSTSSAPLPTASGPAPSVQTSDASNQGTTVKRLHDPENDQDVEPNTKRTKHPVIFIDSDDEDEEEEQEKKVVIFIID
ncbi:uncharacterized protein ACA1_159140 [Acanthamoeba castellanii str. Neff]|uniref:Uncharacterized protein n=1 Tax=Acanthamoeba castellanii (strain ATCC 30010 / Neff) TaxID=1257118 RepID=L8HA68_ACACF|nr:uncharacterized protein ACA1_159140 [Acanthamoeba castellanii str. Neff]ELR22117.1 hypothetical protein ACA1_159140 [Acanthamoeba castellanii str. Neff]